MKSVRRFIAVWSVTCVGGLLVMPAMAIEMEDFSGFWQPINKLKVLYTLEGTPPPLTQLARKYYDAFQASAAAGDRWFDTEQDCLPLGVTRLMLESPFELMVDERSVTFQFEWNRHLFFARRQARHDKSYPYSDYMGHTIANMKGSTLILDSVDFNNATLLDSSGLPHSGKLHVQQSLQLTDINTLVDTMTITDPVAYTTTWQTQVVYRRLPADAQFQSNMCVDRLGLSEQEASARRNASLMQLGLAPL